MAQSARRSHSRLLGLSAACAAAWALTFAIASCAKPEPPQLTPRSASVTAVLPSGIDFVLTLDVYNPNSFPLVVNRVDGTLELGAGTELGQGHAEPNGSIGAKSGTTVSSQLHIPWANLSALLPLTLSPQPVAYTVRGHAKLGSARLNVSLPFTLKGELTREQLLLAGLQGLGPH
jgi:LEA14-like dessication related protein